MINVRLIITGVLIGLLIVVLYQICKRMAYSNILIKSLVHHMKINGCPAPDRQEALKMGEYAAKQMINKKNHPRKGG